MNNEPGRILRYTLKEDDLGRTAGGLVNLVLKNCLKVTGHEMSRAKFMPGGITVDGRQAYIKDRIRPGETLQVILPEDRQQAEKIIPVRETIEILYEDEDVLILNKPPGRVVHPSHGHYADSMANLAAGYLEDKGEPAAFRIIGRLDKDTSGALPFAKNQASAGRLFRQREEGVLIRTYLALAEGILPEKQGELKNYLRPVSGELMKQETAEQGKEAITRYRVLSENKNMDTTLLECGIRTGRTHQIRVQLAGIGHPLVGDPMYNSENREYAERAMLHAVSVRFLTPFDRQERFVAAPLPDDFRNLLPDGPGL